MNASVGGFLKLHGQGDEYMMNEAHRDIIRGCHEGRRKSEKLGQEAVGEPQRWRARANTPDLSSTIDEHDTAIDGFVRPMFVAGNENSESSRGNPEEERSLRLAEEEHENRSEQYLFFWRQS
eukprot:scaffold7707_cov58-Attheya_sp.AAC.5